MASVDDKLALLARIRYDLVCIRVLLSLARDKVRALAGRAGPPSGPSPDAPGWAVDATANVLQREDLVLAFREQAVLPRPEDLEATRQLVTPADVRAAVDAMDGTPLHGSLLRLLALVYPPEEPGAA